MLSATALYYHSHPEARKKKEAYDAKLNKRPEQVKKRIALNKYNKQHGVYGNHDGLDASHHGNKITGYETASRNRGDTNNSMGDKHARGKKVRVKSVKR